jgi:hypothetical protein
LPRSAWPGQPLETVCFDVPFGFSIGKMDNRADPRKDFARSPPAAGLVPPPFQQTVPFPPWTRSPRLRGVGYPGRSAEEAGAADIFVVQFGQVSQRLLEWLVRRTNEEARASCSIFHRLRGGLANGCACAGTDLQLRESNGRG